MDFIISLPSSAGFTAILVVVDRLTKGAHFAPLKPGFSAKVVASVFLDNVVWLHGFLAGIVSDQDPIFLSTFWKQLMHFSGIKLSYSTAYHPQSDGQSEVVNRGLEQYLRAFAFEHPGQWQKFLSWAELCYNTSYHSSIGMKPHEALYGYNPQLLPTYVPGSASTEEVDLSLIDHMEVQRQLRQNLERA